MTRMALLMAFVLGGEATIPMLISVDPNATAASSSLPQRELRDVLAQMCPSMTFRVGAPRCTSRNSRWARRHGRFRTTNRG